MSLFIEYHSLSFLRSWPHLGLTLRIPNLVFNSRWSYSWCLIFGFSLSDLNRWFPWLNLLRHLVLKSLAPFSCKSLLLLLDHSKLLDWIIWTKITLTNISRFTRCPSSLNFLGGIRPWYLLCLNANIRIVHNQGLRKLLVPLVQSIMLLSCLV